MTLSLQTDAFAWFLAGYFVAVAVFATVLLFRKIERSSCPTRAER